MNTEGDEFSDNILLIMDLNPVNMDIHYDMSIFTGFRSTISKILSVFQTHHL